MLYYSAGRKAEALCRERKNSHLASIHSQAHMCACAPSDYVCMRTTYAFNACGRTRACTSACACACACPCACTCT